MPDAAPEGLLDPRTISSGDAVYGFRIPPPPEMTRSEYPDRALAVPTLYAAGAAFFAAP